MADQSTVGGLAAEARLDDPAFYLGDPHPIYARLRREAPVYWCESGGFWALSKHEDIVWAELQANPPFTTTQGLYIAEASQPTRVGERDPSGTQQSGAGFMSDPPGHTNFRRFVGRAFTPRRMADLEPRVHSIASELLDRVPEGEAVNFVEAVSIPLAVQVIAEFLGVSKQHWRDLRRWTDSFLLYLGGGLPEGSPEARQALEDITEMHGFFAQSLAERQGDPGDDLISNVASMEVDGERLPEATQVMICLSVLTAGNETTRNTISGSMVTFPEHGDQWEKLVADPSLAQSATEELLRWVSPVIHFGRRATQPLVIRGQEIAEGDFVVMLYGSANRDEDVWPDADAFDITRSVEPKHLSFGWGLHHCIGAALGRAEVRITLEGLIERFAGWEIAGEVTRHPSTLVNDYKNVPIVLKGN
jgi:cytochrome P450